MGKVSVESSGKLSVLSSSICEVKDNLKDNLKILNAAFATACESWQDKNAHTCQIALNVHNEVMCAAFGKLEYFENVIRRLSNLTEKYENI